MEGQRQILYVCMHVSYCLWWLIEQRVYPERRKQISTEKVDFSGFIGELVIVGVFLFTSSIFSLYQSKRDFHRSYGDGNSTFYFGSLINTAADIQKTTAKESGTGLVRTGIWSGVRHINYTGDLMRYLSFSVIAGSLWASWCHSQFFFCTYNECATKRHQ